MRTLKILIVFSDKPCTNLAIYYQRKIKKWNQSTRITSVGGVVTTFYKISLKMFIKFIPDDLKFVTQQPAYPVWSLGAETGGYLGMFLGYSLLQLPNLLVNFIEMARRLSRQFYYQVALIK